jgi:hypothetical protein
MRCFFVFLFLIQLQDMISSLFSEDSILQERRWKRRKKERTLKNTNEEENKESNNLTKNRKRSRSLIRVSKLMVLRDMTRETEVLGNDLGEEVEPVLCSCCSR